jgi:plastocyanin
VNILPRYLSILSATSSVALWFLLLVTVAHAAVDDPVDEWAKFDITQLDAQVYNGYLDLNIGMRDPLTSLPNPLDLSYPVIEIFLDIDKDSNTGDYRLGAVAGTDYLIKCSGSITIFCTLYIPPYDRLKEMEILSFSQISGASVMLPNSRTLTLHLPTTAIGGIDSLDVFAVAYSEGDNPILSQKILNGNGDRIPNAGALDTATGEKVVRHPGAPVNATMIAEPDSGQGGYQLTEAQFRTFDDQFEITLSFDKPINLSNSIALQGGIVFDSDRSLATGQLQMDTRNSHGLGLEIPTWGGDVELTFRFDDVQTIRSLGLSYGRNYAPTLFSLPINFGSPCGQNAYPLTGLKACNDGSWHVQDNRLVLTGSLSPLDSFTEGEDTVDIPSDSNEIIRHATDGRMNVRVYTVDEATGAEHVTPEMGRAFDTETGQVLEPLMWDSNLMKSESDPQEYGEVAYGIDLVRVDTQVSGDNLIVKGVLSLWSDVDPNGWFEILLDTDMNTSTGELVTNSFAPGTPSIGADYIVNVMMVAQIPLINLFVELVTPEGMVEAHDAFLFPEPNSSYVPDKEDGFTVTIPLESIGSPDKLALFVTTRRYGIIPLPDRFDIAPDQPIVWCVEGATSPNGNCPPTATIVEPSSDPVSIIVGESVNFAGVGNDPDGDNQLLDYQWNFPGGQPQNSTAQNPGLVQFINSGDFTVTFTVTDTEGASTSDTRIINVTDNGANQSPTAVINQPAGNVTINVGQSVTFEGTGTDPDNNLPLTYLWDFGASGVPDSTDEDPGPVTFNNIGNFTVIFTVTDNLGASASDTRIISVSNSGNQPPNSVIDQPVNNATIAPGGSVTFAGSGSDPDNNVPLNYLWNFGASGVPDSTDEDPGSVTFNNPGTFVVTFTVTDSLNLADPTPDTRTITVTASNQPPTAVINQPPDDVTITAGQSVTFEGTGTDPDNNLPLAYLWDFGASGIPDSTDDDPGAVTFNSSGTFTITFTVTDKLGASASDSRTITVTASEPPPAEENGGGGGGGGGAFGWIEMLIVLCSLMTRFLQTMRLWIGIKGNYHHGNNSLKSTGS